MARSEHNPNISSGALTALVSIGVGLEYYDFVVYGFLASVLSRVFFPHSNALIGIIEVFSIFALGYVARPLGGLFFGSLGDRLGRKNIFLMSMLLMAFSTLFIGLLPSYAQIGLLAPVLLLFLRILQGLAFGAELPGASTFLVEHLKQHHGRYCGFALSSVSLGALLGSFIPFLLNLFFTTDQIIAFAWRIPFLLGGLLACVTYFIRKKIQETPAFIDYSKATPEKKPIRNLFANYKKQILLGFTITIFGACLIIFGVGLPAFLEHFYNYYNTKEIYLLVSIGYMWSGITLPFLGAISDRLGQIKMLLSVTAIFMLVCAWVFKLLALKNFWALLIFILIYQTFVSGIASSYLVILPKSFPTSVRFTGSALCYNLAFSLAGFTPALFNAFVGFTGVQYSYLFFVFLGFFTLLGCFILLKNSAT